MTQPEHLVIYLLVTVWVLTSTWVAGSLIRHWRNTETLSLTSRATSRLADTLHRSSDRGWRTFKQG